MASASIISGGVTFTFNEGDVSRIRSNVTSDLDVTPMPTMTPEGTIIFDFNGVTKTIDFDGVLTNNGDNTLSSGSAVTIDEQRQWLEKILNGFQSGTTFISNYTSTWNGSSFINSPVYHSSIEFEERDDLPNGLSFKGTLIVGGL